MDLTMSLAELIQGSLDGQLAVMTAIDGMTPAQYAEPSRLPGWTRAHVVAHLVGNTLAQTRQVEYAKRGERIEVYSGGQPARDADIESRAAMPPAELAKLLRDSHRAWEASVSEVDERIAAAPVVYRDGVVSDVLVGRWMESLVHGVDLGLATATSDEWTPVFAGLLLAYVSERLPSDQRVRIEATDAPYDHIFNGPSMTPPADESTPPLPDELTAPLADASHAQGLPARRAADVHLKGRIADIAAFLADRRDADGIESLGGPLGPLGPYPRGSIRR